MYVYIYIYRTQLHYLVNKILINITTVTKYLLELSVRHMTYWWSMSLFRI